MGGHPKGTLTAPGGTLSVVERLLEVARTALGPGLTLYLVGDRDDHDSLGLERLTDSPAGAGPIGGLVALLQATCRAEARNCLVLPCDMPFVSEGLLQKLAHYAPAAVAVAPLQQGRWQPLFARYRAAETLPVVARLLEGGTRAPWRILEQLRDEAVELPLSDLEMAQLTDWDTPEDLAYRLPKTSQDPPDRR